MLTIQNSIFEKLKETESTFSVKIPLAVESGSRGWGFPSPDSDYDCRFLYVRSLQDYLSIFEPRDVIEYSAGEIFDINGWDIKKPSFTSPSPMQSYSNGFPLKNFIVKIEKSSKSSRSLEKNVSTQLQ